MKRKSIPVRPKFLLHGLLILTVSTTLAQSTDTVRSRDGITVTYTLDKTSTGEKHDGYRLELTARNNNPYDVYYGKDMTRQSDGSMSMPKITGAASFSRVIVYNTSRLEGFGGTTTSLEGDATGMKTDRNKALFRITAGRRISVRAEFTVKTGQQPNLFFGIDGSFQQLEAFKLVVGSSPPIADSWISSCGNVAMTLRQVTQPSGRVELLQRVNNRDQVWVRNTQGTFEKVGDSTSRLTWNSIGNVYTYSNNDGIVCLWQQKP